MADPYNPYTSYSTPAPGGVSYYPPEDQQQPYEYADHLEPNPNHIYAPQSSPYHLAPEPYQGVPAESRGYTPTGQPDYLGPVIDNDGFRHGRGGKVAENLEYYGQPADAPRYITPSASPQPPAIFLSEAQNQQSAQNQLSGSSIDPEAERGLGGSLAGGAAGYFAGHQTSHGFLGALGGAILGNYVENKMKDETHTSHRHRHGHHDHDHDHHHRDHHHHDHHHRSRSHSRQGEDDSL